MCTINIEHLVRNKTDFLLVLLCHTPSREDHTWILPFFFSVEPNEMLKLWWKGEPPPPTEALNIALMPHPLEALCCFGQGYAGCP